MMLRLLLVLATCGGGSAIYARYPETQPAVCPEPSCEEVLAEAEGLARAKLMRSYVSETVKLLESLMASLDAELIDIAKSVEQHTGPACEDARRVLLQVAEPMRDRGGRADLSAGIMEESTAQALEKQTFSADIGSNIVQDTSSSWDGDDLASVVDLRGSSSHKTSLGGQGGPSSHKTSWGGQGGAYSRESSLNPQGSESSLTNKPDVGSHGSNPHHPHHPHSPHHPHHSASNKPAHHNTIRPSPQKGRQLHGASSSSPDRFTPSPSEYSDGSGGPAPAGSWAPVPSGPSCRALRGSPFLVPGLDDWCRENCSNGYCPHTHCVCD